VRCWIVRTNKSFTTCGLLHIQQDSRILMPCIHGVSNLEHSARSKQSFTSTTNSFLSSSVVVSGRKQASRRYSLTSRTPCPCAIHSSKRNTQQLPSKPSAAANSTTYRAACAASFSTCFVFDRHRIPVHDWLRSAPRASPSWSLAQPSIDLPAVNSRRYRTCPT